MLKECDRVLNYGSNECGETVRYADLGLKSNQQSTEGNRTNMSVRRQTRPRAHECSAFDTPPHFIHSQGTGMKCVSHGMGENFCFYSRDSAWDAAGVRGVGVAHVTRVTGHDMFMSTQVAALPPCSPSLPAVRPLDGPQGEDGWRLQICATVTCTGPR